jgi:N-methylhydantoinase B
MIDASGGLLDQDYEMFEQQTPHLLLKHEFLPDSAGAGEHRGGLGVETRYRIGSDDTQLVTFGDGDEEPAFGLAGGTDGTLNKIELHYPDGHVYKTTSKDLVESVPRDTLYIQEAGGGGGYGDPHKRPAAKVLAEVRDGVISIGAARDVYGVAIDAASLEIDEGETAKLRDSR